MCVCVCVCMLGCMFACVEGGRGGEGEEIITIRIYINVICKIIMLMK